MALTVVNPRKKQGVPGWAWVVAIWGILHFVGLVFAIPSPRDAANHSSSFGSSETSSSTSH